MISRRLRSTYYTLIYYPIRLNASRHRAFTSIANPAKVHLGPGKDKYLDGWINVDANFVNAKIDIWADLNGRLPFKSGIIDAFYSHHVIEHLTNGKLPFHFSEMFRCLRKGGIIRIGGPNADMAIQKFVKNDANWFSDFPDKRRSIGGKFENFILCGGEHLTILTSSYLAEIASEAGFENISFCRPITETKFPKVIDWKVLSKEWESTPDEPTL